MRKLLSHLVCVLVVACGSDNNNKTVSVPDPKPVDAAVVACKAASSYGSLETSGFAGDVPAVMTGSADYAHQQDVYIALSRTDAFYLELNADFGGFGSGDIVPGTYALAGDDIDYRSCGICVQLWPQAIDESGTLSPVTAAYRMNEVYMASAGSVTLTMAGGGSGTTISGSVSNIAFEHVTVADDRTQTYDADHCSSSLADGNFSFVLKYYGAAAVLGNRHF